MTPDRCIGRRVGFVYRMLRSINPATGETIAEYPEMTTAEVNRTLRDSTKAFASGHRTALADRLALLGRVAGLLRADVDRLAELITREMGKPITESRAEIAKCATACEYYVAESPRLLADE